MADDDNYPEDERRAIQWADAADPTEVEAALSEACDWFDKVSISRDPDKEFTHG